MAAYRNRHAALQHRLSRLEEKKKIHKATETQRNS
jgi:BMFP domain-containing protein YqiC